MLMGLVVTHGGWIALPAFFVLAIVVGFAVLRLRGLRAKIGEETRRRKGAEQARLLAERNETVANQEARLLRADRLAAVGTLASGVAHEINNPLAVIMTNLSLLRSAAAQNGPEGSSDQIWIDTLAAAQRIRHIVAGLRTFAHGDSETRAQRCDVAHLLERAVDLVRPEIERRGRLVPSLSPVPAVWADESTLVQVFVNLLVNAAQALPEGAPDRNEVRLVTSSDAEDHVVIEVRDTGTGISPETLACIFDPFFSTKPIGVGTGLGLSVSLGIVRALGGEILVDSEPGRGSAFRVVLPAMDDAGATDATRSVGSSLRRVKGALFVDYVRMLRHARKASDAVPVPQRGDIAYLEARIEPDAWYPMETFERMGLAILSVLGPDLQVVEAWGYAQMEGLQQKYPELVAAQDARSTLLRFRESRARLFDFPALAIAAVSEGAAVIHISYGMSAAAEEAASHQTLGAFRRLLELAGATDVQAKFSEKSWTGGAYTTLQLRWTGANAPSRRHPAARDPGGATI